MKRAKRAEARAQINARDSRTEVACARAKSKRQPVAEKRAVKQPARIEEKAIHKARQNRSGAQLQHIHDYASNRKRYMQKADVKTNTNRSRDLIVGKRREH